MKNMKKPLLYTTVLVSLAIVRTSRAEPKLSPMFGENCVLQANIKAPVYGTASPGEDVKVKINDQTKTVKASQDGKWRVELDPMPYGGPYDLKINDQTIKNTYVGEVWFGFGQSNIYGRGRGGGHYNWDEEVKNLENMHIKGAPGGGPWVTVTDLASLEGFSTFMFFFGKAIVEGVNDKNIHFGFAVGARGNTGIDRWLDPEGQKGEHVKDNNPGKQWTTLASKMVGYPVRGIVYYQGENDRGAGASPYYHEKMKTLIVNYRKLWGLGDIPFYNVLLPGFGPFTDDANKASGWAEVNHAKMLVMRLPNVGAGYGPEFGDVSNIHPPQKKGIGPQGGALAPSFSIREEGFSLFWTALQISCHRRGQSHH